MGAPGEGVSLKWIKCLCYHFHPFPASYSSNHSLTPQGYKAFEGKITCTLRLLWQPGLIESLILGRAQGPINKLPSTSPVPRLSDTSNPSCSLGNTTNRPPPPNSERVGDGNTNTIPNPGYHLYQHSWDAARNLPNPRQQHWPHKEGLHSTFITPAQCSH